MSLLPFDCPLRPICITNLPFERELQNLRVFIAVAGNPHRVGVVHENTVLALGPLVTRAWSAPRANHVAGLIEDDDRRRRDAALAPGRLLLRAELAIAQRARALNDPDVSALVHRHARHLARESSYSAVASARTGPLATAERPRWRERLDLAQSAVDTPATMQATTTHRRIDTSLIFVAPCCGWRRFSKSHPDVSTQAWSRGAVHRFRTRHQRSRGRAPEIALP